MGSHTFRRSAECGDEVMPVTVAFLGIKTHQHSPTTGDGGQILKPQTVTITDLDKTQLYLMRDASYGGSIFVLGADGELFLTKNGFYNGLSWMRFNLGYSILVQKIADGVELWRAPAGSNPASLSKIFEVKNNGRITVPDLGDNLINNNTFTLGAGGTVYSYPFGGNQAYYPEREGEFVRLRVTISSNTLSDVSVWGLRDQYGELISVSVPYGTTGTFWETSTVITAVLDRYYYFFARTTAPSGSASAIQIGVTMR